MEDYASNSHRSKGKNQSAVPEKKVNKVVAGNTKVTKKSEIRKFADVFIAEDIHNVVSYVFSDIIVPTFRNALYDIITNGARMTIFGEKGVPRNNNIVSSGTKYSYNNCYVSNSNNRTNVVQARSAYDYGQIQFENYGDAEAVLTELTELLSMYKIVSVMDMYSAAGIQCPATYNSYGWTDLHNARVVPANGYFVIKMPKALPIND